ncbi:dienelactone hydrolase family protein [Stakelama tenebrarum]|uniref:Dienelactone hydrolase family protein n=1 Tax=Stakelama tenebrarum TaxID=2711215 RepID=A0A6G6Y633_9SPHN|nr:dienelactone hydrolase family protein [Sphingosinithalassobacter tenebrarum]QIG80392.1 dienelactone hydrolase family protein [Sphingosinithalassobacter tenebrarum]
MCDREKLVRWAQAGRHDWSLTRRQFAAAAALGPLAACTASGADEETLAEAMVSLHTPDGMMDAFYVRPVGGEYPAVITWPDIAGLREAFKLMARRLAAQGHAVLVVNPYYRSGPAPQFADFAEFLADKGFETVTPWREQLTADAIMRDARAIVRWLDNQADVDTARGIGTNGYCMGGPFTVFTAAAVPGRVRAAASLHGGGLILPEAPHSPHRMLAETEARYLFAIAQNDDAKDPDAKVALREAAQAAGRPAEIEVYPADHGWTVPDSPAYSKEAAERAWSRMTALFDTL